MRTTRFFIAILAFVFTFSACQRTEEALVSPVAPSNESAPKWGNQSANDPINELAAALRFSAQLHFESISALSEVDPGKMEKWMVGHMTAKYGDRYYKEYEATSPVVIATLAKEDPIADLEVRPQVKTHLYSLEGNLVKASEEFIAQKKEDEALTSEEYAQVLVQQARVMEQQVAKDQSLSLQEKQMLFLTTTMLSATAGDLTDIGYALAALQLSSEDASADARGRMEKFWKKLWKGVKKVVKTVVNAVVNVAVPAVTGFVKGAAIGLFKGGPKGMIAGGIAGAIAGAKKGIKTVAEGKGKCYIKDAGWCSKPKAPTQH